MSQLNFWSVSTGYDVKYLLSFGMKQLKLKIKHQWKIRSSFIRRGPWPLRPHSGCATV